MCFEMKHRLENVQTSPTLFKILMSALYFFLNYLSLLVLDFQPLMKLNVLTGQQRCGIILRTK